MNSIPLSLNTAESFELRVQQIVEAAIAGWQAGSPIDIAAVASAHPDYAAELQELLPTAARLMRLGSPSPRHSSDTAIECSRVPLPYEQLGDFRLIREIGRGGMGIVYEAEQVSIGRRVALKVLPLASMLGPQQLNRFKVEARAAGTLDHPNIVAIYSVGVDRGVHFYAMQLIEGQSLAQFIFQLHRESGRAGEQLWKNGVGEHKRSEGVQSGIQSPQSEIATKPNTYLATLPDFSSKDYFRSVAKLGIQAAEALDHAHQNGVLHRDIKPANLLIDETGKLWITDFGLARMGQDAGITATGDLLGTLRYMSPEQTLAKRMVIDHRSDIYSLGVTLYELAALQPPFTGDDRQELLHKIAFDEPRGLRQANPQVPADLETIVLKAIEKGPVDRYATARGLAEDLRRFLDNRPIAARRPTLLHRARKLVNRHRAAAAVVVAAACLLLVIATALVTDRQRQLRENNRFVETSLQAARGALEADRIDEALQRMAEAHERINTSKRVDPALAARVAQIKAESERYSAFSRLCEVAKQQRAESHLITRESNEALSLYRVLDTPLWFEGLKKQQLPDSYVSRVGEAVFDLLLLNAGRLLEWSQSWPTAAENARLEAHCDEARKYLQAAGAFHKPTRAYYWLLANCSSIRGEPDEEELREKAFSCPPQQAADIYYVSRDRAWGTYSRWRGGSVYTAEEAAKDCREMLRLDARYYNGMSFLAEYLSRSKRYPEALLAWQGCLAIHPDNIDAVLGLADTQACLGHYQEALTEYEKALAADPDSVLALSGTAWLLSTMPADELRDGQRAVELAKAACERTQFADPSIVIVLAAACAEVGDFKAALKWSNAAINRIPHFSIRWHIENCRESFRNGKPYRQKPWSENLAGDLRAADALAENRQWDAAARYYDRCLELMNVWDLWSRGRGEVDMKIAQSDELFSLVVQLRPTDRALYTIRMQYLASYGRWSELPPLLETMLELEPLDHWTWYNAAPVYLYIGDEDNYRRICDGFLTQFGTTQDPVVAEHLVKTFALSANFAADESTLQRLAELVVHTGDCDPYAFKLAQALLDYRCKHYELVMHSVYSGTGGTYFRTPAVLSLAMTYCQVGKPNDARRLLGVADQFIAEEMPSFTDGKSSPYWPEWLRTQILRRELVALIAAGTDQN